MLDKLLPWFGVAPPPTGYSVSDEISAGAVIVAILALVFSLVSYWSSKNSDRVSLTVNLWSAWISKDYRSYRVDAYRAIKAVKDSARDERPNMSLLLKDRATEESIGSIEHFVDEAAKLMDAGLLDRRLFAGLFSRSMRDWWALLDGFDRGTGDESFTDEELARSFRILLGRKAQPTDGGRFLGEPDWRPRLTIGRRRLIPTPQRLKRGKVE